jgi:cysteine protease ATG4
MMDGEDDESNSDKVKEKLMSLWNNVKYGWNMKLPANFSHDSPIWMLGTLYHHNLLEACRQHPSRRVTQDFHDEENLQRRKEAAIALFKQDYFSKIWLTYRKSFPKLDGSQLTSDCGWGCMLRSGQMMMAQAFINQYLGRAWRWNGAQSDKTDMIHRMIVKWFLDEPEAPFSLHRLVKIGSAMGKKPGDWYGPATVAHVLTQALAEGFIENPILENIVAYVAQDCTVFIQDIIKLCSETTSTRRRCSLVKQDARRRASVTKDIDLARLAIEAEAIIADEVFAEDEDFDFGSDIPRSRSFLNNRAISTFNLFANDGSGSTAGTSGYASMSSQTPISEPIPSEPPEKWRGVILFIPVRLGGEKFNPVYTECVKSLFAHPSTLGIIGGRPRHSLYFIGCQEDKVIYLDPHLCQEAVDVSQVNFPLSSFHCSTARKMSISKMDPSCTLAFLCRSRKEFMELIDSAREFMVPGNRHTDYPIFVFSEGSSPNLKESSVPTHSESLLRVRHRFLDSKGNVESEFMSDDFVLIS